jgi:phosphoribosylglycinamide formyltransferase-1
MTDALPIPAGVLLSGSGRTLQNFLDRAARGWRVLDIRCVISDRESAFGLERARRAGIPAHVARDPEQIYALLRRTGVELVLLAGWLRLLPIAPDFAGAVLNIHPALLPAFGGKGFYGDRVHRAVLESGATESGCTVHLCDAEYDHGPILLQERVPVLPDDTPEALAARVFAAECEAYPAAIEEWAKQRRRILPRP